MERRKRSWPICLEITKPTRFSPGSCEMYYADEWAALQKSRQPTQAPSGTEEVPNGPEQLNNQPTADSAQLNSQPPDVTVIAEPATTAPILSGSSTTSISFYPENPAVRDSKGYRETPTAPASKVSSFPPDFARHSRRCAVCSHPDRDAIEGDFIRWRSPELIAKEYKIPDRSTIYRHVHSTGLYAWRRRELGRVLEGILESAEHIPLLSSDIITRAVRIYSRLDEQGSWSDPARINFVLTGPIPAICTPEVFEQSKSRHVKKEISRRMNCSAASRSQSRRASVSPNRNSRQIKKSVNSKKSKEKPNS